MEIHGRGLGWFKQYTSAVTLLQTCVQYTHREIRHYSMKILSACISVTARELVSGWSQKELLMVFQINVTKIFVPYVPGLYKLHITNVYPWKRYLYFDLKTSASKEAPGHCGSRHKLLGWEQKLKSRFDPFHPSHKKKVKFCCLNALLLLSLLLGPDAGRWDEEEPLRTPGILIYLASLFSIRLKYLFSWLEQCQMRTLIVQFGKNWGSFGKPVLPKKSPKAMLIGRQEMTE